MVIRQTFALVAILCLCATSARAQKQIGEPFDLHVGESVLIIDADIRVGFDVVVSDSRCPLNVTCLWEGTATARVWGEIAPDNRTLFDLNTNPQFRSEAPYMGFLIRLLDVSPYPVDGIEIDPNGYVTTMVVEQEGPVPVTTTTWGAIKALFR
jgi:hypothetical protein